MAIDVEWRGEFSSDEANALHAEAFGHRAFYTACGFTPTSAGLIALR